ncbi:MAG: hypothetical protein H8D84_00020, partial [Proteobacteria bacterium]|nr:hypothetical protein [Pseudomonadota bacterium]
VIADTGSFHVLKGDATAATGLEVSGYISATNITASGNISASNFEMPTGGKLSNSENPNQHIHFNSSAEIHIEASTVATIAPVINNLASSKIVFDSDDIRLGQDAIAGTNNVNINFGNITASANISASGTITANNINGTINGGTF